MGNIKLGKPDVAPDAPSHVPGIKQGNARGNYERMPGHNPDGTSTAERSTGVDPPGEEPIAPGMPNLSPA
ncbi:MAG: hypothetical protein E6G62_03970 [Actinobacteria bacterium]|nr:MAG: hypothetical protein E6G62_03970 [Actinomycetota bacterium]